MIILAVEQPLGGEMIGSSSPLMTAASQVLFRTSKMEGVCLVGGRKVGIFWHILSGKFPVLTELFDLQVFLCVTVLKEQFSKCKLSLVKDLSHLEHLQMVAWIAYKKRINRIGFLFMFA